MFIYPTSPAHQQQQRQWILTLLPRDGSKTRPEKTQMEDSAATSILDIPPEMVGGILATLDKPSQKRFRLVSNVCATLASPLLFGHIYFDFDSGGTNSLIAISRQPKLCRHVHTIELRRRNGLRLFDDINAWRDATVYGYRPAMPGLDDGVVKMTAGSMTQREWDMLTDDAIRRLYDAYESDRKAIVGYTSQLASALSAIVCDKHNRTLVDQGIFSVHRILTDFDGAVARLSHASRFVHDPGYMGDDWGIHWRTVQFHSHGILDGSSIMDDEDIENIQLFAALRSIMLSTNTITSVNLCTRSHAFWSIAHLRRLLDWNERTESRWSPVDAGLEQWIHDIGGPLTACQYIEAATRHLVLVESAFSRLTILECWIDTVGADGSDELATIAGALSSMLQQATDLQALQLSFCDLAWCEQLQRPFYDGHSSNSLPPRALLTQLMSASAEVFTGIIRSQGLRRLRKLELTLTTAETHLSSFLLELRFLRHLTLRRVAFLPRQGLWEIFFQRLSQSLQLESIELLALEDVPTERPRLLLEPTASIWTTTGLERHCYLCYEDAVVRFILRQATSLPPLDPEDFIRQHCQECEPGHHGKDEAELDGSTEEGQH